MAGEFHTERVNKTVIRKTYTEREVTELLKLDLAKRSAVLSAKPSVRMTIDKRDGSSGPYREYVVELTVDHERVEDASVPHVG
jgi:hypothetical protein